MGFQPAVLAVALASADEAKADAGREEPATLAKNACNVHTTCMSSKTISLKEAAYERLRAARRYPEESFSAVVLRATWPESTTTGKALLDICRERGAIFDASELDRVEALKRDDGPAIDKWKTR